MEFANSEKDIKCKECQVRAKVNEILYQLLFIEEFEVALNYIIKEVAEYFKVRNIFVIEKDKEKDLITYKKYVEFNPIKIKRKKVIINDCELNGFLSKTVTISIQYKGKDRLYICLDEFEDIRLIKILNRNKSYIKDILEVFYKKKVRQEYLTQKSYYDSLTGCHNRNYFERKIKSFENKKNIGVIICDLDRLKQINDTLGHAYGDDIIQVVVKNLRKIISKEDLLFRIGGDEFVIITENKCLEQIEIIVDIIKKTFCIYKGMENKFPISVSVGFALKESCTQSIKDTFKAADYSMYQHKLHHKDRSSEIINDFIEKHIKNNEKTF